MFLPGELMINKNKKILNMQNFQGETPLHRAILNKVVRLLMVDILIAHGADVNIV
jgi:ankyrin repeat protein